MLAVRALSCPRCGGRLGSLSGSCPYCGVALLSKGDSVRSPKSLRGNKELGGWGFLAAVGIVLVVCLAWNLFFDPILPTGFLMVVLAFYDWAVVVLGKMESGRYNIWSLGIAIFMTALTIGYIVSPWQDAGLYTFGIEMGWW